MKHEENVMTAFYFMAILSKSGEFSFVAGGDEDEGAFKSSSERSRRSGGRTRRKGGALRESFFRARFFLFWKAGTSRERVFNLCHGQFCEQTKERKKCLAGNCFYGEVQSTVEISYLKALVENENYYCIPEAEVYYNDAEKSAAYAVFWLWILMRECKKYGMKVVFSFEPRDMIYEETERTVKWIERNYPDADLIELCTEECGKGWAPAAAESVEEIENLIRASYGSAFLSHPILKEILPRAKSLSQLPLTLRQLNIIRRVVETNKEKPLRTMIYLCVVYGLR